MITVSAIQTLPMFIVEETIKHTLSLPTISFKFDAVNHHACQAIAKPLRCLCQSWRAATRAVLSSHCMITINSSSSIRYIADTHSHPTNGHYNANSQQYVRHVFLDANYADIASGKALLCVNEMLANKTCFPRANQLFTCVKLEHIDGILPEASHKNIEHFVNQAKQLFPTISKSTVMTEGCAQQAEQAHGLSLLIQGLHAQIPRKKLIFRDEHMSQTLQPFVKTGELTSLICRWDSKHELCAQIMHSNSASLEKLGITYHTHDCIERLYLDKHSQVVTYPYLEKLMLSKATDDELPMVKPADTGAPFSRLRLLEVICEYPFSDDILFRGNSSTLNTLKLNASSETFQMLNSRGVFGQGKLRSLQRLTIVNKWKVLDPHESEAKLLLQSVSYNLSNLKRLWISGIDLSDAFIASLLSSQKTSFNDLCLLSLHHSSLTLTQMTGLITKLPALKTLSSQVVALGEEFQGMDMFGMFKALESCQALQDTHLKEWYITNIDYIPVNTAIVFILLLSNVCPRLTAIIPIVKPSSMLDLLLQKMCRSRFYTANKGNVALSLDRSSFCPEIRIKRTVNDRIL